MEKNYHSISHFRNAASHRSTYYSTIVKMYKVFGDEYLPIKDEMVLYDLSLLVLHEHQGNLDSKGTVLFGEGDERTQIQTLVIW